VFELPIGFDPSRMDVRVLLDVFRTKEFARESMDLPRRNPERLSRRPAFDVERSSRKAAARSEVLNRFIIHYSEYKYHV
jgi:hypothetical protein